MKRILVLLFVVLLFGVAALTDPQRHEERDNLMQSKRIELSTADLLSMAATPILALPAPGAGKMYVIHTTMTIYHAGSVPYTVNPNGSSFILGNEYNGLWDVTDNRGLLDQTVDTVYPNGGSDDLASPLSAWDNQPVYIFENTDVPMTAGNGTVSVEIYYSIVNL